MTAAGTSPDSWQEVCLIGIMVDGGSFVDFGGLTDDITGMDWGEKDIEGKPTLSGGRRVTFTPMTDESITLKIYPVDAMLTGSGMIQHFHPQSTDDSTQPIVVDNTRTRKKHALVILWAETLPVSATTTPADSKTAYRIQIVNAYMTRYVPTYDGKVLMAEVTFKWAPFNSNGVANKREESTDGTQQLAAATTSATALP